MKRFTTSLLPSLLLFSLLLSCSNTTVTGGGSDHPNEIVALVQSADGVPVRQARITIYRKNPYASIQTSGQFELFDSTKTGEDGSFSLRLPDGSFALEASTPDSSELAFVSQIFLSPQEKFFLTESGAHPLSDTLAELNELTLQKAASLSGSILSTERSLLRVELAGVPRTTTLEKNGRFTFRHLPPGPIGLLTLHFSDADTTLSFNLSRRLRPGEHLELDPIVLAPHKVMIDDFEDGDGQISLANLFGNGWWYSFQQPWGSILGHPDGLIDISEAIIKESGSNVLHLAVKFPDSTSYPGTSSLALVGFHLGTGYVQSSGMPEKAFFDFSTAENFSFQAKGEGKVHIQVATKATKDADGWGHFISREQTLSTQGYQEINIPFDSLFPPPWSMADSLKMKWSQVSRQVYAIDFMFTQTSEIWIDDIQLIGPKISDL